MVKRLAIVCVSIAMFLASFGAGWYGCYYESLRHIDGLDKQFAAVREYLDGLERENQQLTITVGQLKGRLDTASKLVDEISGSGQTALETVRRVIGNLQKLKEVLGFK